MARIVPTPAPPTLRPLSSPDVDFDISHDIPAPPQVVADALLDEDYQRSLADLATLADRHRREHQRDRADDHQGIVALGGEEPAIAGWQIKRDGTYRGIIEIVEEQT